MDELYKGIDVSDLMNIEEVPKPLVPTGSLDEFAMQAGINGMDYDEDLDFPEIPSLQSNPSERNIDIMADYIAVRDNYYFQQTLLKGMAKKAYQTAMMTGDPKSLSAFTDLMNQMTNNNKQILEIQKRMHDLNSGGRGSKKQEQPTQTQLTAGDNTTIFVGSPADLIAQRGGQQEIIAQQQEKVINGDSDEKTNTTE